jgi:hypothetical protein
MNVAAETLEHARSKGHEPDNRISPTIELDSMANNAKQRQDFPTKTHQRSGYTWSRAEDEPGFSWLNVKAVDEAARAWENLCHKEFMIKSGCLRETDLDIGGCWD